MIFSEQTAVQFHDPFPRDVDVAIIGGGVIGISTAWFLAANGIRTLVCEKGRIAGEQSSRNWGWVRQQGRDPAELPLMMESNRIWKTLDRDIEADTGFVQHGVMYVGESDKDAAQHEAWMVLARQHGLDSVQLTRRQIEERVPGFRGEWKSGVMTPSDGRAEPFIVVPAMAAACQRRGVLIRENCAVRGLSISAGKVSGVITEDGETRCQTVVCAGGAWSSLFAARHGLRFPQLSVKSTVARTAKAPEINKGNFACNDIAVRRRQDGGYTIAPAGFNEHMLSTESGRYLPSFLPVMMDEIMDTRSLGKTRLRFGYGAPGGVFCSRRWKADEITPFEKQRVLNPLASPGTLRRMQHCLANRLPALSTVPWVEHWTGMIDVTPDIVPVMDHVDLLPGFYLASGFCGHGFGIGPAAGRVMADLIQGNPLGHDLSRFRFRRFSDGSKMLQGPTI